MNRTYIVKQTNENTWVVIDENGEVVNTITKDILINYCKNEFEDHNTECISADIMIDGVWWNVEDDYNLDFVDSYCQEFEKFITWFDYVVVEYLAQEIVSLYKQRLRNWE